MVKEKKFQKHRKLVVSLLSLPVLLCFTMAASSLIGSAAPHFRVQSGDGKELNLEMIKGKVTAIFYENKDLVDANKRLKDELNKLYFEQSETMRNTLVRLPVVNCSEAIWPFLGTWKRRLREHSKKKGVTIYCDWNGKMLSDYQMNVDESNIVIIDKGGRIRFFTSGEVPVKQIDDVKRLLKALAAE